MIDEGTLLFAGVMGLGLAAALITGASLAAKAIARRITRHDPPHELINGDCPLIPDDLKFHAQKGAL